MVPEKPQHLFLCKLSRAPSCLSSLVTAGTIVQEFHLLPCLPPSHSSSTFQSREVSHFPGSRDGSWVCPLVELASNTHSSPTHTNKTSAETHGSPEGGISHLYFPSCLCFQSYTTFYYDSFNKISLNESITWVLAKLKSRHPNHYTFPGGSP